MEKVKKQYGIWTGIAMVIGIVIGSGVFFKSDDVLKVSNGDLRISILAWLVGGLIMVASGFCFAVYATKIQKFNGVVDYVEEATNKKVGYGLAWLITTFYYPIIASIVALLSGAYFFTLFGVEFNPGSYQAIIFAFIVITLFVAINYLSPMLAAKFQISSTVIKLIPILFIAIAGVVATLISGGDSGIFNAFSNIAKESDITDEKIKLSLNFGEAVKATAFAYEGWVCATAINAELKNPKKELPKALVIGTILILVFYIIYFISLSSFLGNSGVLNNGDNAAATVFDNILGVAGKIIFTSFIVISCLGTVNGVVISCCRGMYTMSCRGQGICPEKFSKLGKNQSVSLLSCLYGYACIILMLIIWVLAIKEISIFKHLGKMDEIICALIYGVYVTMYIYMIRKFQDENIFKRYIMPIVAIIGSIFFVICATGLFQFITTGETNSLIDFGVFMGLFFILMFPCIFFYKKDGKEIDALKEE